VVLMGVACMGSVYKRKKALEKRNVHVCVSSMVKGIAAITTCVYFIYGKCSSLQKTVCTPIRY
jgi:hypothetical protein